MLVESVEDVELVSVVSVDDVVDEGVVVGVACELVLVLELVGVLVGEDWEVFVVLSDVLRGWEVVLVLVVVVDTEEVSDVTLLLSLRFVDKEVEEESVPDMVLVGLLAVTEVSDVVSGEVGTLVVAPVVSDVIEEEI